MKPGVGGSSPSRQAIEFSLEEEGMNRLQIREVKGPWAKFALSLMTGVLSYVVASLLDPYIPSPSAAVAYGMGCFSGYLIAVFDSWEGA